MINSKRTETINESTLHNTELKYPTFDNSIIDDQLRTDITYEILMYDFKSVHDSITLYKNTLTNMIIINPGDILKHFKHFNLSFINFHINSFLIQRSIELMSYVIKFRFESYNSNIDDNEYLKIIKNEFENKTVNDLIIIWLQEENFKIIIDSYLNDKNEVTETFEKGLENEKFILQYTSDLFRTPSICGIGVLLKYLKMILERSIADIENLRIDLSEDIILNFFQDCCKLQIVCNMIKNTFITPETDIFNLKESSEEWINLKQHYERIVK